MPLWQEIVSVVCERHALDGNTRVGKGMHIRVQGRRTHPPHRKEYEKYIAKRMRLFDQEGALEEKEMGFNES